jgi:2'-5' RNA ligase
MKIRAFVAIAIPDNIRRRAMDVAARLSAVAPEVKWVEPQSLHWTLNFLGNVEQRETGDIAAAIAEGAQEFEPFELAIHGAGAFPSPDRPRTLWLGVGEGRESIIALQAGIEKSLEPLGFRGEARSYTPHLTIGRPGRGEPSRALAEELAALADFDGGKMFVDEVVLYSSELTREGPVYEPLAFTPLGS